MTGKMVKQLKTTKKFSYGGMGIYAEENENSVWASSIQASNRGSAEVQQRTGNANGS